MKSILFIAIAILVSFLVCDNLAIADGGLARIVHCRSIDSASGIFAMKIDPSELDGSGPARYTLSKIIRSYGLASFRSRFSMRGSLRAELC